MSENNENTVWNNKTGSFIKRPGKGWLHPDEKLQNDEIIYHIKYIGMIPVNEPMKSLSFEMRTLVARESIRRVAEVAQSTTFQRKNKKNDEILNRILSSRENLQNTGTDVALHINIQVLRVNRLGVDELLFQHHMQNISFACGGDTDIQDYVAYVAKDEQKRACYVFQCPNSLANNVITTIGQAFELRFKNFLNKLPTNPTNNNNNQISNGSSSNSNNNFINNNSNNNNRTGQPPPLPSTTIPVNLTHEALSRRQSAENSNDTSTVHSIDENLQHMVWFHGLLSRENAEKLLKNDGEFLVRVSAKAEKQYVLSGRYQNECRHIILVDPSGTVRTRDRVFKSIFDLIKYHQDHNVPITSRDNELLLLTPVSRNA